MTKLLEKAGLVAGSTVAAFAVSAVALADSALAITFYPLELSGLSNLQTAGVAPGTQLQGPTQYFGERWNYGAQAFTKRSMGTFTITLVDQLNANLARPAGNAAGDLVLGVKKTPEGGSITLKFDFTPNNGKSSLFPGLKISQLTGVDGGVGPTTLNPFADPTDDFSDVTLDGSSWTKVATSPLFNGGAVNDVLSWSYNTTPTTTGSADIPFTFVSDGTTKSLLVTYKSNGTFLNNGGFNISTAYVPTPALLPGLLGLGVAALRKRNEDDEIEQES
ncbi:MAG: PTPA-CTERM sorting domain-containing protein [Leptolyngbyaceae cyanobacterium SM2_5_2]|nr:PTPA-CTERM sorting domain-containing protein [Leptolyngbyaceae cyanobacterium SM2_5_2]